MKKPILLMLALLLSISLIHARTRIRNGVNADILARDEAKLQEYTALSAEEMKARTDEIFDYIDSLSDEVGHISQDDAGITIALVNNCKKAINQKTTTACNMRIKA